MSHYKSHSYVGEKLYYSEEKIDELRKRRRMKEISQRATENKRQMEIEQKFHHAMREMHTTTNPYRHSYLHWILYQMFRLFDYESGLKAINDKAAYESWLAGNTHRKDN